MDTKLTKTQNRKIFKTVLVILSAIFFFEMAFSSQKLYYFFNNNVQYQDFFSDFSLEPKTSALGDGFSAYAEEIRGDISAVEQLCLIYISDEAVADGTAFENTEKSLRAKMESRVKGDILSEKISAIEEMYVYDYNYGRYTYPHAPISQDYILQDFSSEEQIEADINGNGITVVDGVEYYKGYPINAISVDEQAIRTAHENEFKSRIVSERSAFASNYEDFKSHLADLKNFEYYFVNKTTGQVYTNMDVSSIEEAAKDMTEYSVLLQGGNLKFSDAIKDTYLNVYSGRYIYDEYGNKYRLTTKDYAGTDYYSLIFGSDFDPDMYNAYIHVNMSDDTVIPNADNYSKLYADYAAMNADFKTDVITFFTFVLLWIVTLIILAVKAGNVDENGSLMLTFTDKMPNSIHFLLSGSVVVGFIVLCFGIFFDIYYNRANMLKTVGISLLAALADLFFVEWLMSVSRQIKSKQLFKNTITNKILLVNFKKMKEWWFSDRNKLMSGSIRKKIFIPFVIYILMMVFLSFAAMFFATEAYNYDLVFMTFTVMLIFTIIAALYIRRLAVSLDNMLLVLADAEQGNFEKKVYIEEMPSPMKELGEKTNNLTNGIKVAVDQAVKDERMKTELITNVSHDLKTPLTSIITYTDLLKMCDIQDEKAKEYIGVLDEKSGRLKRLIEDLVEASKASTGNIKIVLAEINLNEMISQVFGENEEALHDQGLDLKFTLPDDPVVVVADGQKTYRVIENLFSNVKKYAMPGTRVYLEVSKEERFATVSVKNISRDEMHFDVERLTERFVRGDESRSTEGSGLGLSIAKSLTELQGGKFKISTDGDLFKVEIKLPLKV